MTIEWPEVVASAPNRIALLPAGMAEFVIGAGYAAQPSDEEIATWNTAWDALPASAVNTAPVNEAATNVATVNTAQTAPDANLVTATTAAAAAVSAMAAQAPNLAQDGQTPAGGGEGSQTTPTPPGNAPQGASSTSAPKPQASKGGRFSGKK